MERYELARTIHQERIRALEITLHRRRLLQPSDDVARSATHREPTATTPPAAAQPAASGPPRPSPLTR